VKPAPAIKVGDRVVVRYRLDDGRATDALGELLAADEQHLVVETKRGREVIAASRIIAAKRVPPALERRPRPAP
jgi:hypothetical protein